MSESDLQALTTEIQKQLENSAYKCVVIMSDVIVLVAKNDADLD